MYRQRKTFYLVNQIASLATYVHQRSPIRREYLAKWAFSLNRGPDYSTSLRISTVPRLRKVQYRSLGVSRGPGYLLPTENPGSIGDAEGSHYSTEQLDQKARLPHFHANRYSVDTPKGPNPKGRPAIQYTEIPPAAQTTHIICQSDQPPLQRTGEPTLGLDVVRDSTGSAFAASCWGVAPSETIIQHGATMARRKKQTRKKQY